MNILKPKKLQKGDTVAIVSPSWGGPSVFPHIYENGLKTLVDLGLKIKEYPSARKEAAYLYEHPEFRAKDINDAFADPEVAGIFTSIGGEDSVRILPYLDIEIVKKNPKIFLGYSDTTTMLTYFNLHGLVTFHGPSIMAGFSQWNNLDEKFQSHVRDFLFGEIANQPYPTFDFYSNGYPSWQDINNTGKINEKIKSDGWRWLQGQVPVSGEIFGGNIEVLEFLKGTDYWPPKDFWKGKIFFLDTSEDKPKIDQVKWMLRNYGSQGLLDKIPALMFGRARDYTDEEKKQLDEVILKVVKGEFKNDQMLISTNMDFGHTDPQFILPLGIKAEIDPINKCFKLLESPFV